MAWATAASSGTHPFGSGVYYATKGTTVASPSPAIGTTLANPWVEIAQAMRITAPERSVGDTKITHLKSPNKAHEYIPGYVEGGSLTFRLVHSNYAHNQINNLLPGPGSTDQRYAFAIQFADAVVIYFDGYLKSKPVEVTDGDDPIAIDVTVKVSGDLTMISPA